MTSTAFARAPLARRFAASIAVAACLLFQATAAPAQTITEDFNNIAALPGSGWVMRNNSQPIGTTNWFQGDPVAFPAQGGSANAYVAADFDNGDDRATISNWLLTPPVMLANGATVTFWTRKTGISPGFYPDRLQLRMSAGSGDDVGILATDVGSFTTLLLDINPTYSGNGYPVVWTRFEITITGIPPTPSVRRLAFRYFVEDGGPLGSRSNYIGVDTFALISPVPATLAAEALAVDGAGNGVLQPNEPALIAPSWRNVSPVYVPSLTGRLLGFGGPAGATYTMNDRDADYGVAPPGALVTCSDCYIVTASAATRPQVHWDAAAVEQISAGGAEKSWTLHVGDSFADVSDASPFYRFVEILLHKGVTGGCSPTGYCPSAPTSRDQMAVFVLVARHGPGYAPPPCGATPMFADVPSSNPFCRWIEELARRGVAGGCGGGNYCPAQPVTREQMAVFVLRTQDPGLNPQACSAPAFDDVPAASPFCRWIAELARRNIVSGCGGGNYCPRASVTREQMGVFLSVTFGLTLYGP